MIRTGRFSASQKLDILRRYWNGAGVPDLGRDRHGGDWVTGWQSYVRSEGVNGFTRLLAERVANPQTDFDREARALGVTAARNFVIAKIELTTTPTIPASLVVGISQLFEEAALAALRYTVDDGEVPTLEIVRNDAGVFPTEFLLPNTRALCLFCGRFFGRADAIRLHDAPVSHATLVDNDAPRLDEMRLIYPANWTYVAADYRDFLREAVASDERYDVITADTWHFMGTTVAWEYLSDIMTLCDGIFIVNYFKDMFEALKCETDDLLGLTEAVSAKTGVAVQFLATMRRTDPVYWAAMRPAR